MHCDSHRLIVKVTFRVLVGGGALLVRFFVGVANRIYTVMMQR